MRILILLLAAVSLLAVLADGLIANNAYLHHLYSGMVFISLAMLTVMQFMCMDDPSKGKLHPIRE